MGRISRPGIRFGLALFGAMGAAVATAEATTGTAAAGIEALASAVETMGSTGPPGNREGERGAGAGLAGARRGVAVRGMSVDRRIIVMSEVGCMGQDSRR